VSGQRNGAWVERVAQLVQQGDWIHRDRVNGYVRAIEQVDAGGAWERFVFTLEGPMGTHTVNAFAGQAVKVWEDQP
jgi:hypothetical protein